VGISLWVRQHIEGFFLLIPGPEVDIHGQNAKKRSQYCFTSTKALLQSDRNYSCTTLTALSTYNWCVTFAAFRLQAESSFSDRPVAVAGVSHLHSK